MLLVMLRRCQAYVTQQGAWPSTSYSGQWAFRLEYKELHPQIAILDLSS